MHHPSQQQVLALQRLKQIQKSNKHVNNLIQSAKKMIFNKQQLSNTQKQVLQVKISIQNDHLKNVFCKIDCPHDQFTLEFVRKREHKDNYCHDKKHSMPYQQNQRDIQLNSHVQGQNSDNTTFIRNYDSYIKESQQIAQNSQKEQNASSHPNQSFDRQPNAKITISRYVKHPPEPINNQQKPNQTHLSAHENKQQDQYEIDLSDDNFHQTVFIKPSKTSKVVVNTRTEPIDSLNQNKMAKSYFVNKQRQNTNEQYTPNFSNYRKHRQQELNEQLSQKSSVILDQYPSQFYQDEITIKTPNNQLQVISTQTQERLFAKPNAKNHMYQKKKSPKTELINFNQGHINNVSSYDHYKSKEKLQASQPSTSYKEILNKNKERLQNSREKLTPYPKTPKTSKSHHYELDLEKLYKKKSQSKKRLYGPTFEQSPKLLQNTIKSSTKKYSIANSHKVDKVTSKATDSSKKQSTSRKSLSITKPLPYQLSPGRRSPLHSSTLKSYHLPCQKCVKCKHPFSSPKQPKQTFEQYYLAKKYLTPEGEQQCYNFLKSQGIPQKDWGSYITEYVYRQLSRVYQVATPRQFQGNVEKV